MTNNRDKGGGGRLGDLELGEGCWPSNLCAEWVWHPHAHPINGATMRIASLELSGHHERGGAKPRKTTPMPAMANHKSLLPTGLGARRPGLEDSLLSGKTLLDLVSN